MIFCCWYRCQPVTGRRCGIDEFLDAGGSRAFQYADRSLDVDVHILGRSLDRRHDVPDPRKMEDEAGAVECVIIFG